MESFLDLYRDVVDYFLIKHLKKRIEQNTFFGILLLKIREVKANAMRTTSMAQVVVNNWVGKALHAMIRGIWSPFTANHVHSYPRLWIRLSKLWSSNLSQMCKRNTHSHKTPWSSSIALQPSSSHQQFLYSLSLTFTIHILDYVGQTMSELPLADNGSFVCWFREHAYDSFWGKRHKPMNS